MNAKQAAKDVRRIRRLLNRYWNAESQDEMSNLFAEIQGNLEELERELKEFSPAAVLGSMTSSAKAKASRENGRKGGRPRTTKRKED